MKNKKTVIIIILIVVAYLGLAIILFGKENFMNKIQGMSIILSNGEKWQLKDGKWSDIENQEEYNWKEYDVYIDNNLLGKYDLMYNKKWYIYDNNRKSIKYDGKILGIRGNKNYEVIDFKEENFDTTGENLLREILTDNDVDYPNELSYSSKIDLDIDGDNQIETIYSVSNAFVTDENINKKFSVVFIDDDQLHIIYHNYVDKIEQYSLCIPKVNTIIDIDKDSKYEIILQCEYFSQLGSCASLYEIKNEKYKVSKSC